MVFHYLHTNVTSLTVTCINIIKQSTGYVRQTTELETEMVEVRKLLKFRSRFQLDKFDFYSGWKIYTLHPIPFKQMHTRPDRLK